MLIDAKPQWIAKMYAGKTGRDHLGLGSVSSDQILPSLSPGINVLTFHPRYHSFYVFLLDEYWRRDRPRSRANWVAFFRPREFIFSVGAFQCDQPEHGNMRNIVGGQKTGSFDIQSRSLFDTTFHYIDSELGGYGLYYRTVMAELGLIYPGGHGLPYPVDVPTEFGKQVAELFRSTVSDTTYYQRYFDDDITEIPLDVIQEYIRKACLCQLKLEESPDHAPLLETFLQHGSKVEAKARRETFRLFLDLGDQTKGYPLDEDSFRQLVYFQYIQPALCYSPRAEVVDVYVRWRLYQAREYYAFALNALWIYFCNWGVTQGGENQALLIIDFWKHIELYFPLNWSEEVTKHGTKAMQNYPAKSWEYFTNRILALAKLFSLQPALAVRRWPSIPFGR